MIDRYEFEKVVNLLKELEENKDKFLKIAQADSLSATTYENSGMPTFVIDLDKDDQKSLKEKYYEKYKNCHNELYKIGYFERDFDEEESFRQLEKLAAISMAKYKNSINEDE